MKQLIIIFLMILSISGFSQTGILRAAPDSREEILMSEEKEFNVATAACGTPFLSTGYPTWTNYWAGWMIKIINTNACPIIINRFEARFKGTSGYRIYTKTGTFIGFETTPAAWTLVGSLASLTGTSTTAPTAIPITVNVTIPAGGSQSFYLTRSDNLVANRHLYITGAGIAGTTVYASNADLSITEGEYVDPYFSALQVGVRRPSFDVCYIVNCALPIELISFTGTPIKDYNLLEWKSATEINNDHYTLESSNDGMTWFKIAEVDGAGNSYTTRTYSYKDYDFRKNSYNYYTLSQTDFNGQMSLFKIIVVDNLLKNQPILLKRYNVYGEEVGPSYKGLVIETYTDGTTRKIIQE